MSRGFSIIGLEKPKCAVNVGAVLRAAYVYEASAVIVTGRRYGSYDSIPTDTYKTRRHMPVFEAECVLDAIPYGCVPIAVDLIEGAQSLITYKHPQQAYYIFGAEDATLGKRITDHCRDVIMIPTLRCMNLAACVNVVLYDRLAKQNLT